MNQHLHAVAGYIQLHRNDSEDKLRFLERQLLTGSPEYDAVVELLSELERVKEVARLDLEAQEKKARHETEERRFQTQLSEARRQGSLTRRISWIALGVSAGALAVSVASRVWPVSSAPQPVLQAQQLAPTVSPPVTNSAPAIPAKPAKNKP